MKLKTALIASAIWTVVVIGLIGVVIWYIANHPVPGVSKKDRAAQAGGGLGVFAGIGYGCIWLPYAAAIGKKKRAERERAKTAKKSQKRKGRKTGSRES
jgi:hypothetical protein